MRYLSESYIRVVLDEMAMNFSARIYNLYTKHKDTKGFKITDGDIVNGAVSIAKGCPILTTDSNDYPRPFFKTVSRYPVAYESSSKYELTDFVYMLEPDIDHLKHCAKDLGI